MPRSVRENVEVAAQEGLTTQAASVVRDMIAEGVRISLVEYEEFAGWGFEPPSTFFTRSAMGVYYFYHTRSREKAQGACDATFGKGHYTVTAAKTQKGKGGALTCTGTHTRKK